MGLEGNSLLWTPSTQLKYQFGCLLSTTRQIEDGNRKKKTPRIDQQEGGEGGGRVSYSAIFEDPTKNWESWLGNLTTSAIFLRSCSIGLSPFLILRSIFTRWKFPIREGHQNEPSPVFFEPTGQKFSGKGIKYTKYMTVKIQQDFVSNLIKLMALIFNGGGGDNWS